MRDFNIKQPFQTKSGWPARLLGVLDRTAFPFVVAVRYPGADVEMLHCYSSNGDSEVDTSGGPLTLVNLWQIDIDYDTKCGDYLQACVTKEESFPPNCNPFQHEHMLMGTPLTRSWMIMHEGDAHREKPLAEQRQLMRIFLINTVTGERFAVRFTPNKFAIQQKVKS